MKNSNYQRRNTDFGMLSLTSNLRKFNKLNKINNAPNTNNNNLNTNIYNHRIKNKSAHKINTYTLFDNPHFLQMQTIEAFEILLESKLLFSNSNNLIISNPLKIIEILEYSKSNSNNLLEILNKLIKILKRQITNSIILNNTNVVVKELISLLVEKSNEYVNEFIVILDNSNDDNIDMEHDENNNVDIENDRNPSNTNTNFILGKKIKQNILKIITNIKIPINNKNKSNKINNNDTIYSNDGVSEGEGNSNSHDISKEINNDVNNDIKHNDNSLIINNLFSCSSNTSRNNIKINTNTNTNNDNNNEKSSNITNNIKHNKKTPNFHNPNQAILNNKLQNNNKLNYNYNYNYNSDDDSIKNKKILDLILNKLIYLISSIIKVNIKQDYIHCIFSHMINYQKNKYNNKEEINFGYKNLTIILIDIFRSKFKYNNSNKHNNLSNLNNSLYQKNFIFMNPFCTYENEIKLNSESIQLLNSDKEYLYSKINKGYGITLEIRLEKTTKDRSNTKIKERSELFCITTNKGNSVKYELQGNSLYFVVKEKINNGNCNSSSNYNSYNHNKSNNSNNSNNKNNNSSVLNTDEYDIKSFHLIDLDYEKWVFLSVFHKPGSFIYKPEMVITYYNSGSGNSNTPNSNNTSKNPSTNTKNIYFPSIFNNHHNEKITNVFLMKSFTGQFSYSIFNTENNILNINSFFSSTENTSNSNGNNNQELNTNTNNTVLDFLIHTGLNTEHTILDFKNRFYSTTDTNNNLSSNYSDILMDSIKFIYSACRVKINSTNSLLSSTNIEEDTINNKDKQNYKSKDTTKENEYTNTHTNTNNTNTHTDNSSSNNIFRKNNIAYSSNSNVLPNTNFTNNLNNSNTNNSNSNKVINYTLYDCSNNLNNNNSSYSNISSYSNSNKMYLYNAELTSFNTNILYIKSNTNNIIDNLGGFNIFLPLFEIIIDLNSSDELLNLLLDLLLEILDYIEESNVFQLSIIFEKYSKNIMTFCTMNKLIVITKDIIKSISHFTNSNKSNKVSKAFLTKIIFNPKIFTKFETNILIQYWEEIYWIYHKENTDINFNTSNMTNIPNSSILNYIPACKFIELIIQTYDSDNNAYCCIEHFKMLLERKDIKILVMNPSLINRIYYMLKILEIIFQRFPNQIKASVLYLNADISPCFIRSLLVIIKNAIYEESNSNSNSNSNNNNTFTSNFLSSKGLESILYILGYSCLDNKQECLKILYQIYTTKHTSLFHNINNTILNLHDEIIPYSVKFIFPPRTPTTDINLSKIEKFTDADTSDIVVGGIAYGDSIYDDMEYNNTINLTNKKESKKIFNIKSSNSFSEKENSSIEETFNRAFFECELNKKMNFPDRYIKVYSNEINDMLVDKIYDFLLKWLLDSDNNKSIVIKEELIINTQQPVTSTEDTLLIDDFDNIINPQILNLLMKLVMYSPIFLKQKFITDLIILTLYNTNNCVELLKNTYFFSWLLNQLLSIYMIVNNKNFNKSSYIGIAYMLINSIEKIIVSLFVNTIKNEDEYYSNNSNSTNISNLRLEKLNYLMAFMYKTRKIGENETKSVNSFVRNIFKALVLEYRQYMSFSSTYVGEKKSSSSNSRNFIQSFLSISWLIYEFIYFTNFDKNIGNHNFDMIEKGENIVEIIQNLNYDYERSNNMNVNYTNTNNNKNNRNSNLDLMNNISSDPHLNKSMIDLFVDKELMLIVYEIFKPILDIKKFKVEYFEILFNSLSSNSNNTSNNTNNNNPNNSNTANSNESIVKMILNMLIILVKLNENQKEHEYWILELEKYAIFLVNISESEIILENMKKYIISNDNINKNNINNTLFLSFSAFTKLLEENISSILMLCFNFFIEEIQSNRRRENIFSDNIDLNNHNNVYDNINNFMSTKKSTLSIFESALASIFIQFLKIIKSILHVLATNTTNNSSSNNNYINFNFLNNIFNISSKNNNKCNNPPSNNPNNNQINNSSNNIFNNIQNNTTNVISPYFKIYTEYLITKHKDFLLNLSDIETYIEEYTNTNTNTNTNNTMKNIDNIKNSRKNSNNINSNKTNTTNPISSYNSSYIANLFLQDSWLYCFQDNYSVYMILKNQFNFFLYEKIIYSRIYEGNNLQYNSIEMMEKKHTEYVHKQVTAVINESVVILESKLLDSLFKSIIRRLEYKRKWFNIKKSMFQWKGLWSNTFMKDLNTNKMIKFKTKNHYTNDLCKPYLTAIFNFEDYIPDFRSNSSSGSGGSYGSSKFNPNNLFMTGSKVLYTVKNNSNTNNNNNKKNNCIINKANSSNIHSMKIKHTLNLKEMTNNTNNTNTTDIPTTNINIYEDGGSEMINLSLNSCSINNIKHNPEKNLIADHSIKDLININDNSGINTSNIIFNNQNIVNNHNKVKPLTIRSMLFYGANEFSEFIEKYSNIEKLVVFANKYYMNSEYINKIPFRITDYFINSIKKNINSSSGSKDNNIKGNNARNNYSNIDNTNNSYIGNIGKNYFYSNSNSKNKNNSNNNNNNNNTNNNSSGISLFKSYKCEVSKLIYSINGKLILTYNSIYFIQDIPHTNKHISHNNHNLHNNNKSNISSSPYIGHMFSFKPNQSLVLYVINITNIKFITKRRYYYKQVGIEIFTKDNKSYCLNFKLENERNDFLKSIKEIDAGIVSYIDLANISSSGGGSNHANNNKHTSNGVKNLIQLHNKHEMSTLEFINRLNYIAGRSYYDLTQYPVFPWILNINTGNIGNSNSNNISFINKFDINKTNNLINNYKNEELVIRYLNKNIGSLLIKNIITTNTNINPNTTNEENSNTSNNLYTNNNPRQDLFLMNYEESKPNLDLNYYKSNHLYNEYYNKSKDENGIHFFNTHYSTPIYISLYMSRIFPYTFSALRLQGDKFDDPNRQFISIPEAYSNIMSSSTDLREIIPEFYYLPEIFMNVNKIDFGKVISNNINEINTNENNNNDNNYFNLPIKEQINNVKMPNNISVFKYIELNRIYLESNNSSSSNSSSSSSNNNILILIILLIYHLG